MAAVSKTRTYETGETLTAEYYNDDRDEIIAGVNSIANAQIDDDAGIAYSKLNLTGAILNADLAGSIAVSKISFGTNIWVRSILSLTSSDISAGTGKDEFTIPATIPDSKFVIETVEVEADTGPGSGKTLTIDINKAGTSILSSAISLTGSTILDTGNTPKTTALSAGDRMTLDIDTATSGLSTTRVRVNLVIKHYFQTS